MNQDKQDNAGSIAAPVKIYLVREQAYRDFMDEPWRGDFFGAAGCRQPVMA